MMVIGPLPLLISIPGTAGAGIVTICGGPGFAVTRPEPRDVMAPGAVEIPGGGTTGGATTGGGGAMVPPAEGNCASAAPVRATRQAIASDDLIILHAPEIG